MNDQAFRVGEQCDKYEIVSLIAVGGSGEVYRAVQRSTDREVALKCLQFRHASRGDLKARMEMESRALGRINHPNVVTVFDAGCTDRGVVWIAMELLMGHTLREVLQERWRLAVREAVACAIDVGEGLVAAHEQGIIHRDIKPENVFITDRGIVKVLDLGTAKLHGWGELKSTDKGRVVGTPAYMAPEHIRCSGVDERTDIYALGLLLYEMLAGHPFANVVHLDDYQEVARLQLYGRPRPLDDVVDVPASLSRVVLRALEKAPEERQQRMGELVSQLRAAADIPAPVIHVTPRQPGVRDERPPGGHRVGPIGPHGTVRIVQPGAEAQEPPRDDVQRTPAVTWSVRGPERGDEANSEEVGPADRQRRDRSPTWVWKAVGVGSALGAIVGSVSIGVSMNRAEPSEPTALETEATAASAASGSSSAPPANAASSPTPETVETSAPVPASAVAVAELEQRPPSTKEIDHRPPPNVPVPPPITTTTSKADLGPLKDDKPPSTPPRATTPTTPTGRKLPSSGL